VYKEEDPWLSFLGFSVQDEGIYDSALFYNADEHAVGG
jgi:hypothetical protein